MTMTRYVLEIVEIETEKVIHTIDVTEKSPSQRERVEAGANINLDHNRYFTRIALHRERD